MYLLCIYFFLSLSFQNLCPQLPNPIDFFFQFFFIKFYHATITFKILTFKVFVNIWQMKEPTVNSHILSIQHHQCTLYSPHTLSFFSELRCPAERQEVLQSMWTLQSRSPFGIFWWHLEQDGGPTYKVNIVFCFLPNLISFMNT